MNIEKFKTEEKVRLALLHHRGDVTKVAAELSMDLAYVKKCATKFATRQKRDIDRLVANDIMMHVLLNVDQRYRYIKDSLDSLRAKESSEVSGCCGYVMYTKDDKLTCGKCNEAVKTTKVLTHTGIHAIMLDYLRELRDDDRIIVDFADKMGFTNKIAPVPGTIIKIDIMVIGDSPEGRAIIGKATGMMPMEREKLRKDLERHIISADVIDTKNEEKPST